MVPIVEPEVLMAGAHSLARCLELTRAALRTVFNFQPRHFGLILKPEQGDP